jgi:colicin import membrane protein
MAERQETSVMVSIQELLRDAQDREAQEKVEGERRAREEEQRRFDEIRRKQDLEQERLNAEEQERQRRVYEEQKRQAELRALQEAAVERARLEAESHARLAEMTSRQEHERQLHVLRQDKSKRKLQFVLAGLGLLVFSLAIGGGIWIRNALEEANVARAQARALQAEKDTVEAEKQGLFKQLENTQDPAQIAELQQQLRAEEKKLNDLQSASPARRPAGPATPGTAKPASQPAKPCNCTPGDPLCSCLQ